MAKGNPFAQIKDDVHVFRWFEVCVALIKAKGLHEGQWKVGLQFADLSGANINTPHGLSPGAIVPVATVYLTEVKDEKHIDALTVDAAKVNPAKRIVSPEGFKIGRVQ